MEGRFGNNSSTFTTSSSALHAIRRTPLNHMFSRRSILKLEPVIQEKVELLCKGIAKTKKQGDVLVLSNAYSAFTGDVITVRTLSLVRLFALIKSFEALMTYSTS